MNKLNHYINKLNEDALHQKFAKNHDAWSDHLMSICILDDDKKAFNKYFDELADKNSEAKIMQYVEDFLSDGIGKYTKYLLQDATYKEIEQALWDGIKEFYHNVNGKVVAK